MFEKFLYLHLYFNVTCNMSKENLFQMKTIPENITLARKKDAKILELS